jgi:hypothetical protein
MIMGVAFQSKVNAQYYPASGFQFLWRLTPVGDPPSPRAAHAATAVGTMVVIQVHLYALPSFHHPFCQEAKL